MARANPTWGEERIADELRLKLGLTVSSRTVGRYLRGLRPSRGGRPAQRWATFVRNHAHAVLACDFFTTITVRFRLLYVFVVLDVGAPRIVHWKCDRASEADWTIQQCRAVITGETAHRFLVHDRDAIYAPAVDDAIRVLQLCEKDAADSVLKLLDSAIANAEHNQQLPADELYLARIWCDEGPTRKSGQARSKFSSVSGANSEKRVVNSPG
jgi:ribosomal protein L22